MRSNREGSKGHQPDKDPGEKPDGGSAVLSDTYTDMGDFEVAVEDSESVDSFAIVWMPEEGCRTVLFDSEEGFPKDI